MIARCNVLIRELTKNKLRDDMGLLWWTSKRRKHIHDIIELLDALRKNPVVAQEKGYENLNIEELESFLIKLLQSYDPVTQDLVLKEYPDLDTTLEVNERIDRIITFLKIKGNHIDDAVKKYLDSHRDMMFAKKAVYKIAQLMFAKDLAKNAGSIEGFASPEDFVPEKKEDGTVVTKIDKRVDSYIISHIRSIFPNDGILAEESWDNPEVSNKRLEKKNVWIVDPIDGTNELVKRQTGWSVIIAKTKNHKPVIGVLYFPKWGKLYYAKKGKGAFLEHNSVSKRLFVSNRQTDLIAAGGTEIFAEKNTDFRNYFLSFPDVKEIIPVAGAGKIAKIAEGEADFTVYNKIGEHPPKEWDDCASDLILHEAGGRLTDFIGNRLVYNKADPWIMKNGLLATNGIIHKKMLKYVGKVLK